MSIITLPDHQATLLDRNIQTIFQAMRQMGAKEASAHYDGSGDEGDIYIVSIDDVPYKNKKDGSVSILVQAAQTLSDRREKIPPETQTITCSLSEAIQQVAEQIIEIVHDGYENNDGGGGKITFNAQAQACIAYCYDNETDSIDDEDQTLKATRHDTPTSEKQIAEANLAIICEQLKARGFKRLEAEYSGCGDNGDYFEFHLVTNDNQIVHEQEIKESSTPIQMWALLRFSGDTAKAKQITAKGIVEAIHDAIYTALDDLHPGYEINEGGGGKITLHIEKGKMDLQPYHNETEEHGHNHLFLPSSATEQDIAKLADELWQFEDIMPLAAKQREIVSKVWESLESVENENSDETGDEEDSHDLDQCRPNA